MKTLYATDLDGTLLGPDAKLSAYDAQLYRKLVDSGVLITFITARTPATVEPLLQAAHPTVPGVAMTGAAIWNPARRVYERIEYHDPATAQTIARICHGIGFWPFIYTLPRGTNSLEVYHPGPKLTELEAAFVRDRELNDLKTFHIGQAPVEGWQNDTVLFFGMGDPDKVQQAADAINAATDCQAAWYPDTYNPGIALLEVFGPGVTKADGLLRLKERLGADRVVAFGDNLNDIPMLKAADLGVAVENAHPAVKEAAGIVIGPNTAHAVLNYIANAENVPL